MKKYIVFCSVLTAGLFIISSYQNINPEKQVSKSSTREINKETHKVHIKKIHTKKRGIASIDFPKTQTKHAHDETINRVKESLTKDDVAVINKVKDNLPNLANSEFKVLKRLKISGKSIFVVNTKTQNLSRSFTALIDNKSGRIEKSWGKTHYEIPHTTRHYPTN